MNASASNFASSASLGISAVIKATRIFNEFNFFWWPCAGVQCLQKLGHWLSASASAQRCAGTNRRAQCGVLDTQGYELISDNAFFECARVQFAAASTTRKARSTLKALGIMINNSMQAFVDARYKNLPNSRVGTLQQFGAGATSVLLWSVTAGCTTGQNVQLNGGSYPATF